MEAQKNLYLDTKTIWYIHIDFHVKLVKDFVGFKHHASNYKNGHCSVPKPRWILRTIVCMLTEAGGRLAAIAEEYVSSSSEK